MYINEADTCLQRRKKGEHSFTVKLIVRTKPTGLDEHPDTCLQRRKKGEHSFTVKLIVRTKPTGLDKHPDTCLQRRKKGRTLVYRQINRPNQAYGA
jgi:hypothetical protein